MRKKLLSTLLALCMVLVLLPTTALAEDYPTSGTCGENATWTYDDSTKTLTISGSGKVGFYGDKGFSAPYTIMSTAEKIEFQGNFTTITGQAFASFSSLESISIPDSITTIEYCAFRDCEKLSKVVISAKTLNLARGIFQDCPLLSTAGPVGSGCSIEFGWAKEIPDNAFHGCAFLAHVMIPDTVSTIGANAFAGCASLGEITIPKAVTHIMDGAFSGCTKITQITIPENVQRINWGVFSGCKSLEFISVDSSNKEFASQDGILFDKEKKTLLVCPEGKDECTIPMSVSQIDLNAFANCSRLTEIVIPDSVTTLTTYPNLDFGGCVSLKKLTLSGKAEKWYQLRGLSDTQLTTAIVTEGATLISGTFSGASKLTTVYLPATLKSIGYDTFANCTSLATIYFAGTEAQWTALKIASNNQEISLAKIVCNTPVPAPSEVPSTPGTPDTPSTPDTPTTPTQLTATVSSGGLGKKVSIQVQSGHWLTIQTRRAGSISISSIQAPTTTSGVVTVSFSAPSGSVIQIWETATEMQFSNGIPITTILSTVVKNL